MGNPCSLWPNSSTAPTRHLRVPRGVVKADGVPEGFMGLDCGPASIELNAKARHAKVCDDAFHHARDMAGDFVEVLTILFHTCELIWFSHHLQAERPLRSLRRSSGTAPWVFSRWPNSRQAGNRQGFECSSLPPYPFTQTSCLFIPINCFSMKWGDSPQYKSIYGLLLGGY